jgi:hypothetical protein
MQIGNKSFETVEQIKCLGKTLTNKNSILKEIKADSSLGMLAIIRCKVFCLPVCFQKYKGLDTENYTFSCFPTAVKLGLSPLRKAQVERFRG